MAGTLQLTDLKDEITVAMGGRTDIAYRLSRALNFSQGQIARITRWIELDYLSTNLSTPFTGNPNNDKFMALDFNPRDIYSITLQDDANSRKLTRVPNRLWDRRIPRAQFFAVYIPSHYTWFANKIEFWRVPDKAYPLVIRAAKWPTPFADASPTMVSDLDNKDDMLVALAVAWLHFTLKNYASATTWVNTFKGLAQAAIDETQQLPDMDYLPHEGIDSDTGLNPYWIDPFTKSLPSGGG